MARVLWPLLHHRPSVRVILTSAVGDQPLARRLLADTGAGTARSSFELILDEDDCLLCGGSPSYVVGLGGAFAGSFPVYLLRIRVPELGFDEYLPVVGVPNSPADGIAGFRFLNRFAYGNFGDPGQFGLEV